MRRKKFLSYLMAIFMLVSIFPLNLLAERHKIKDIELPIIVNDHYVMSDVHPFIENSRTYVPIRFIAEELGYDVKWNGSEKKVTIKKDNTSVELKINSKDMFINGELYKLDAPARLRDDRTFVPLRAIAEAFGEKVDWSEDYKSIFIGENPKYNEFYPVVYYYGNKKPVISEYTINIVTYRINVSGTITTFNSMKELYTTVDNAFIKYYVEGIEIYPVKEYTSSKIYYTTKEPETKKYVIENPKTNESNVPIEKQIKDKYYVKKDANDLLVGTWYGPSFYGPVGDKYYETNEYCYITSLGNNKYRLDKRTILSSDPSSQAFITQYGTYYPDLNAIYVDGSDNSYNLTGLFAELGYKTYSGYLYLENNFTKLSWGQKGSSMYYEKY